MTTWRDSASAQAQQDFDRLLTAVMPFAEHALLTLGGVLPYGAALTLEGTLEQWAAAPGVTAHASPEPMAQTLLSGARMSADHLRAVVVVSESADAGHPLRIHLEHREGIARDLTAPYTFEDKPRRVMWHQVSDELGTARVWIS